MVNFLFFGGFQVSQWYDLVVFTASMEIYGAAVADKLDSSKGILKRRYYRQVSDSNELCGKWYLLNIGKITITMDCP